MQMYERWHVPWFAIRANPRTKFRCNSLSPRSRPPPLSPSFHGESCPILHSDKQMNRIARHDASRYTEQRRNPVESLLERQWHLSSTYRFHVRSPFTSGTRARDHYASNSLSDNRARTVSGNFFPAIALHLIAQISVGIHVIANKFDVVRSFRWWFRLNTKWWIWLIFNY